MSPLASNKMSLSLLKVISYFIWNCENSIVCTSYEIFKYFRKEFFDDHLIQVYWIILYPKPSVYYTAASPASRRSLSFWKTPNTLTVPAAATVWMAARRTSRSRLHSVSIMKGRNIGIRIPRNGCTTEPVQISQTVWNAVLAAISVRSIWIFRNS